MSTYKLSIMILVPIFVKEEDPVEGLFSVRYNKGHPDEFERLFDKWADANEVLSYFLFNEEYLKDPYFTPYTIDDLSKKVQHEAAAIEVFFLAFEKEGFTNKGEKLQSLFKPLDTTAKQFSSEKLQSAKLVIEDVSNFSQPILRLYGLRIDENTFIITGGAIKLTHFMQQHPDTREELDKLESVRSWLIERGVSSAHSIKQAYYEQG